MNKMFGITGIQVKRFDSSCYYKFEDEINNFLAEYDGNIIDIQYVTSNKGEKVFVVYKAFEE